MNRLVLAALFAVVLSPLALHAEDSRFFVFKDHWDVIELAPEGHFYRQYAGRFSTGSWKRTGDDLALAVDGLWPETMKLRFDGDALFGEEEHRYVKRETLPELKFPWPASKPVTLVALDEADGKPVTEFTYDYGLQNAEAKYWPPVSRPIPVKSAAGEFTLDAPESCEIHINLMGPDLVGGHESYKTLRLTKDTPGRRIEIKVRKGVTVHGIAVEAGSGKPVAGAIVSPSIFTPPGRSTDREHSELSGPDGQFTIRGADPKNGIRATHPDYEDSGAAIDEKNKANGVYEVRVEFTAGVKITGTVVDAAGKPIEGVHVDDGSGKEAVTGKDGTFVLKSPSKWEDRGQSYYLKFEKEGFNDRTEKPKEIDPKGLSIVLTECLSVEGTVLDDKGAAVTDFKVVAGRGVDSMSYACSSKEFKTADGRFEIALKPYEEFEKSGKVWIGVSAPGWAPWISVVDEWKGKKSIEVRLARGCAVRGKVELPKGHGHVTARLVPARTNEQDWMNGEASGQQELATRELELGDGDFTVGGLNAGRCSLSIFGERVAPSVLALAVPEGGLDVGSVSLRGTGSVIGKVYKPKKEGGKPWAFADGELQFAGAGSRSREDNPAMKPTRFKTDENGAFRVDGVPAGLVAIAVRFNISADMIGGHFRFAQVVEGKDTEIRYFEPDGGWELKVNLPVGDDSKEQWGSGTATSAERKVSNVNDRKTAVSFELKPLGDGIGSWPEMDFVELKRSGQVVLPDVSPGKYRLRVVDWQGSRGNDEGALFEGDIEVGEKRTFTVPLGAGAITGKLKPHGDIDCMVHVMAANRKTGELRHARCDLEGNNFCLRYLPDAEYLVYAHDHKAGWCKVGELSPKNMVLDAGSVEMAAGATISGTIQLPAISSEPLSVRASDAQGFEIPQFERDGAGAGKYSFGSLWPGKWTVKLFEGDKQIGHAEVEVKGTETVTCDLKLEAK